MKNLSGLPFTGSVAGVVFFSVAPGLGASSMLTLDSIGRNIRLLTTNRLAAILPTPDTFIAAIKGLHDRGILVLFAVASQHWPQPESLQSPSPDERPC